jgi:hypothetical protein
MAVAQGISKQIKMVKQSVLGTPVTAGSQKIRRVTAQFNLDRDTYSSNEIVSHQQSTGATVGVGKTSGKLNCEMSAGTYDDMWATLCRKTFAATTPATAVGLTVSAPTAGVHTLTRGAGSWFTDGFRVGDIIRITVGSMNAANLNKNLLVTAITSATACSVVPINGVAMFAEGPIAGNTVTVIGKKTYVPMTGHTNEYFTVEQWFADLSKSEMFVDVKVASADLTLPATGIATVNFDMPGLSRVTASAEALTSPTAESSTSVLSAVAGKVVINGAVTSITGATLKIDGNIQAGEAEVGSSAISDLIRGRVAVSGSFTAKFSDTTLQSLYNTQAPVALHLVAAADLTGTSDFVSFTMTAVKIFSDSADDGEKEIVRTYNFTAQYNAATTATDGSVIVIQDSQAA